MASAQSPLTTQWAKDVKPDAPRPEYPRPRMERKDWQSLNGRWDFAFVDANGKETGATQITVPFPYEAALSGVGADKGVHDRVVYRRKLSVPAKWKGKRVRLNFGAVDWEAKVLVNGKAVGEHRGGYAPFSIDITDALTSGDNALEVRVYDPVDPKGDGIQPKGKQLGSHAIWYTRTTGIWLPVWMEPVETTHIQKLEVMGDMNGLLTVNAKLSGTGEVETSLFEDGNLIAEGTTDKIRVSSAQLWSPESPKLYDVVVRVKQDGKVVDEVRSYVAFRSAGMADGKLTLNGKPYFYRGVLDQGYWPDGNYTPPTDAAIKFDVETTKALGFNMARKHVKVEDPRWYYWCDKIGLAVWQDMPSSHAVLADNAKAREIYKTEWTEVVDYLRDQSSIVHWVPFNEDWGHPEAFQDEMVALTRTLDPTRPITDASGWTQRDKTDVWDDHDYSNDPAKHVREKRDGRPQVVGEYGGVALPIEGHTWSQGWGYQSAKNADDLLRFIRRQTYGFFDAGTYGSGYVYTQLTDVEQELNGLLTYDRLPKAPLDRLKAIFEGRDKPVVVGRLSDWSISEKVATNLVPESTDGTDAAKALIGKALETVGDDAKALKGEGFARTAKGDEVDFVKIFGATDGAVVYAQRTLEVDEDTNADLLVASDDGVQVWLDGKPIHKFVGIRGVDSGLDTVPVKLTKGRHTILLKVAQGKGGWGASVRLER